MFVHLKYLASKEVSKEGKDEYLARLKEVFEKSKTPIFVEAEEANGKLLKAIEEIAALGIKVPVIIIPTRKDVPKPKMGWKKAFDRIDDLGVLTMHFGGELAELAHRDEPGPQLVRQRRREDGAILLYGLRPLHVLHCARGQGGDREREGHPEILRRGPHP